jgi:hypothetical protein
MPDLDHAFAIQHVASDGTLGKIDVHDVPWMSAERVLEDCREFGLTKCYEVPVPADWTEGG